jgi:two-component system chemotaxis response regulator CheB
VSMHVLVVDDSAVVRQTLSSILAIEPGVTASVAGDPYIAMQKMRVQRPDVILLDLNMPRMDGLTFLDKIMAEDPIPVVVCSSLTEPQSDIAFGALARGAVDVVAKPKVGVREFLEESALVLVDVLRAAAQARMCRPRPMPVSRLGGGSAPKVALSSPAMPHDERIIAIGASTGGPEALSRVLSELPADSPCVMVVQHMPELFTAHFARRLNDSSAMEVAEACDGDRVHAGRALIAPGNRHMILRRDARGYYVSLSDGWLVNRHRPSVDVLFHSVAATAAGNAMGVLLTGMGADGAEGMLALKQKRAATVAQDEATCIVFGMPREAINRGAVDEVLPLPDIGPALRRWIAASVAGALTCADLSSRA